MKAVRVVLPFDFGVGVASVDSGSRLYTVGCHYLMTRVDWRAHGQEKRGLFDARDTSFCNGADQCNVP